VFHYHDCHQMELVMPSGVTEISCETLFIYFLLLFKAELTVKV
jgi:hypothetical protein